MFLFLKFFNDINKKLNDRLNLPISKELFIKKFGNKEKVIPSATTISDKIQDLEENKFKEYQKEMDLLNLEKENITQLKMELNKVKSDLSDQIESFNFNKEKEIKEFEKWKDEETKIINLEKKSLEKLEKKIQNNLQNYNNNNNNISSKNKKEKEEIECFKNIITQIQEENKIKEINYKITIDKLKKKLEESNNKIDLLNQTIADINNNTINRPSSSNTVKLKKNPIENSNKSKKNLPNYDNKNINHSINLTKSLQGLYTQHDDLIIKKNKINFNRKLILNTKLKQSQSKIQKPFIEEFNKLNNSNSNNRINRNSKDFKEIKNKYNTEFNISKNNKSDFTKINSSEKDKLNLNTNSTVGNYLSEPNIELNFDDGIYDLIFPEKYHPKNYLKSNIIKNEKFPDGKIVKFYDNDKREVLFPSGVRKEIFGDSYQIVYFNNLDIKQVKKLY